MQKDKDISQEKLDIFTEKVITELGATLNSALVFVGDKLGLYKAMAKAAGPITSEELAKRTETNERYIREWLAAQVCSNYIVYDRKTNTYSLPPEHALVLVDENNPFNLMGLFQHIISAVKTESSLTEAFRTGSGIDWSRHDNDFFEGQERFSRPNYKNNLVQKWIPALDSGMVEIKLKEGGAKVADIGCGHGISTMIMAKAYPNSTFTGFDYHQPSIEKARQRAAKAGFGNRVKFEIASSAEFPGDDYSLITFFDCFHDMGNPLAVAKHAREALKQKNGTCMIIEFPFSDRLQDNLLNPLARAAYAASVFICFPASLAQKGSAGLGLIPGEAKIRDIMRDAGFTKFKCSFQNTRNMVLEAHL
jgi:ubiquinone/menaquinone biosynthesis C-methylase UbiE